MEDTFTHSFILQSGTLSSARVSCFVTRVSPRKTLSAGLRTCVHCSRGDPTRLSEGFWCKCGTKAWMTHSLTSDQLHSERIETPSSK